MKKVAHKFLWGIIFLLLFTYCSSTLAIAHPVKAQDISTETHRKPISSGLPDHPYLQIPQL